jgi:penicillin-binding protein 1C
VKIPLWFGNFSYREKLTKYRRRLEIAGGIFLLLFAFALPRPLFTDPTCMVLDDKKGDLLGAKVAKDGQWRFPQTATVNDKFAESIIAFEDKRFYYHLGFDPMGFGRAVVQNLKNGKVVSGGSTITMQVVRLMRKNQGRTIVEKIIELFLAMRIEYSYSKSEILALYASNAPFGGNVVGIDAASWRYYGKKTELLSWAEAATLAVLPNAPSLIHINKNREKLLRKRNRLLDKLSANGSIDATTLALAKAETLPEKLHDLPHAAPHLLDRAYAELLAENPFAITHLQTTLDANLQNSAQMVADRYYNELKNNDINNLACMISDTRTGEVLAYIGNVGAMSDTDHGAQVDVITAPRSTGSIMKPFLYALMQEEGFLLPKQLVTDIPTTILGYRPENYSHTFDGVTPANTALARSLNIPAVRELNEYGVARFHQKLNDWGMTTITQSPNHYGLPLILGGAEANLWDLMGIYSSMGRTLSHFSAYESRYDATDWRKAHYIMGDSTAASGSFSRSRTAPKIGAGAIWLAFQAMQTVERPSTEGAWELYESTRPVAWKTGTSWGGRDAWAIGVTPEYTVGVWIGNADGEGRPGLIGVTTAAPVLFDLFNLLPNTTWWRTPFDDLRQRATCRTSGYLPTSFCTDIDTIWTTLKGGEAKNCPFHQPIYLDKTSGQRVNTACESIENMTMQRFFVLPPLEEQFYRTHHPDFAPLPPFRADCAVDIAAATDAKNAPMQWVYPRNPTKIIVPKSLDGSPQATVFEIAHHEPSITLFWYLDGDFIGKTANYHQQALRPSIGKHRLTVTDSRGASLKQDFEVVFK